MELFGLFVVVAVGIVTLQRAGLALRAIGEEDVTNWYPLRQGDLGYVLVLYKPQEKRDSHVQALLGGACGGVLIYDNLALTQCACMRSFFHAHDDIPPNFDKVPPGPRSPQDIRSKDIYVTYWPIDEAEYIADQKHALDQNPQSFMTESSCYNDIKAVAEGKKDVEILQASIIVVTFSPGINLNPAAYIPFNEIDQSIEPYMFVFGMSKKNPAEEITNPKLLDPDSPHINFDPTAHTVEFEFNFLNENCPYTEYCKMQMFSDTIPSAYNQTVRCFCKKPQRTIQLCEGVPGFPVTIGFELIGVMASPVDCDTGSTMVSIFGQETVQEIDTFLKEYPDIMVEPNTHVTANNTSMTMSLSTTQVSITTREMNVKVTKVTTGFNSPKRKASHAENPLTPSNTFLFQTLSVAYLCAVNIHRFT